MARRKKSINDILNQRDRIIYGTSDLSRIQRAYAASDRYIENARKAVGLPIGYSMGHGADIKVSRRVYMGLSNG